MNSTCDQAADGDGAGDAGDPNGAETLGEPSADDAKGLNPAGVAGSPCFAYLDRVCSTGIALSLGTPSTMNGDPATFTKTGGVTGALQAPDGSGLTGGSRFDG